MSDHNPQQTIEESAKEGIATREPETMEKRSRLGGIRIKDGRINLDSMQDLWSLAQVYVSAGTVPQQFRGDVAKTFVALQVGAEVGMQPMQALKSTVLINGYPSLWGDGPVALALSTGQVVRMDWSYIGDPPAGGEFPDSFGVLFTMARARKHFADPLVVSHEFTVGDAKRAGLWRKSGPWQQYPKRMLLVRARAMVLRDLFADALGGYHIAEELADHAADGEVSAETAQERMLAELTERSRGREPVEPPAAKKAPKKKTEEVEADAGGA